MRELAALGVITTILSIAFGILSIILFFKVWGMTNDVDKLMRHFCEKQGAKDPLESPKAGRTVTRKSDGVKMRVDRISNTGTYSCLSIDGIKFEGMYTEDEITIDPRLSELGILIED